MILGITNPSNPDEKDVQVVGYERMIHHPRFSVTAIENDLMLIKLRENIELNDYVKVVSLPEEPVREEAMCMVSTWAYNLCDDCESPHDNLFSQSMTHSVPSLLLLPSAIVPKKDFFPTS